MLTRIDSYRVTTLCRFDPEMIEKTRTRFNETVRHLKEEKPEKYIGHIMIGYLGTTKPQEKQIGDRDISVCRLIWKIKGDPNVLDDFFNDWKMLDENPFYAFRVERDYSISDIIWYMTLTEKEDL